MWFFVQVQAPAGNWVDSIGVGDYDAALRHAEWLAKKDRIKARVVKRTDEVLVGFNPAEE